jgi:hypothetical protein
MRRRPALVLAAMSIAVMLAACGDGDGGGVSFPDGGVPPSDAAPAPYCAMRIAVDLATPRAPTSILATAEIDSEYLIGAQTYAWQVRAGGALVEHTEQDPDGRQIAFPATQPGVYQVRLQGSVAGYACTDAVDSITVAPADAPEISYRLRLVPAPGQPAVSHERIDTIVAGIDYHLGRITLPSGVPVSGSIRSAAGDPLAAYVRATRSDAVPVEAFADVDGQFSMRLESLGFDVLVVPVDPAHAPARFPAQMSETWTLIAPPAATMSGAILDPAGQPLAGARVALRVDDLPATVAVTDAQGAFAVPAPPGSAAALLVVPPASTGLPWLELAPSAALASALAAGNGTTISYAAGLAVHDIAPVALDAGGAALGDVRATWIARSVAVPGPAAAAGTLSVDGQSFALAGAMRATATAGADGAWPPVRLPEGVYDVILEPAGDDPADSVTARVVDLAASPVVDSLRLASPALVRGRAVDPAGSGLPGIQITARPLGLLAHSPAAGAAATTASDGTFALALAPDAEYELVLDSADRRHGRTRITVTTPAAGESLELAPRTLLAAARLTGQVALLDGAGAAGVAVLLSCLSCDATAPLAEAVTDSTGAFVLAVPYPVEDTP